MNRMLQLAALAATALALVATSRTTVPCAAESVTLESTGSCGAPGVVVVTSAADCTLRVDGAADAGLPGSGFAWGQLPDAGIMGGFTLFGAAHDGGTPVACGAVPADGGLALSCEPACDGDAGSCGGACTGLLSPPR